MAAIEARRITSGITIVVTPTQLLLPHSGGLRSLEWLMEHSEPHLMDATLCHAEIDVKRCATQIVRGKQYIALVHHPLGGPEATVYLDPEEAVEVKQSKKGSIK